jgi:hypothetical protein
VGRGRRQRRSLTRRTTQCLTDISGAVTDRFASDAWGVQVKRTGTSINRHWLRHEVAERIVVAN